MLIFSLFTGGAGSRKTIQVGLLELNIVDNMIHRVAGLDPSIWGLEWTLRPFTKDLPNILPYYSSSLGKRSFLVFEELER